MRMVLIAASAAALVAAGGAGAQRMVTPGPGMGYAQPAMSHVGAPMMRTPGMVGQPGRSTAAGSRWGSKIDGRWWAGANAPGGWHSYRRLSRGSRLPGYWSSPSFFINDWSIYGLGEPPAGYNWARYYDDAVLIDDRGQVYDSVNGLNWDQYESGYIDGGGSAGYGADYGAGYAAPAATAYPPQPGYAQPAYAEPGYAQPGAVYPGPAYVERRNSGVGGALVGAAAGGVAGNLIGGRGHRVEGTLIGAGVGGVAGYAIDRSQTHRVPVAPAQPYGYADGGYPHGQGAGYAPPPAFAPPPPGAGGVWHSPDGGTTISTTSVGGYNGGSTTVVTVQTAPVVTTTTTEIVEDNVTYSRHRPVRHKWVRKPACGCR